MSKFPSVALVAIMTFAAGTRCSSTSVPIRGESCEKGLNADGSVFDTCRDRVIRCRRGDEVYVSVELVGLGRVRGTAECEATARCTASAAVLPDDRCGDIEDVPRDGVLTCNVSVRAGTFGGFPRSYKVTCGVD